MKTKYICFVLLVAFFSISCSQENIKKATRLSPPNYQMNFLRQIENPVTDGFFCDSLNIKPVLNGKYIHQLIAYSGSMPIDTILLSNKKIQTGAEAEIIKADLDFNGFCELVIPDKNSLKNGAKKHYYYLFDLETLKFIENTTLPAYIGEFKLDIKNQRVKLYCPDMECFAYYKLNINKKFELVQGEFRP